MSDRGHSEGGQTDRRGPFPRLDRRAWGLVLGYTLAAAAAVSLFAALTLAYGPHFKQALFDYLLPEDYGTTLEMLLESLWERLGERALALFALNGALAALAVICCPFKELLSRRLETTNALVGESFAPWPIGRQILEELRFAFLYLVAYDVIFWIAYPPFEPTRLLGRALGYAALFVFFDLSFLCPLLLRHRIGYGRMVRTFFRRPVLAFGFAALFLAPSLLAAYLLRERPLGLVLPILLGIQVVTAAPAAVVGTWLAARLLPTARALRPASLFARGVGFLCLLGLLIASGLVFGRLLDSVHAKSQILKCRYSVDWTSLSLKPPTLFEPGLGLRFELEIENPTEVDVRIERSRLELNLDDRRFSEVRLGLIEVPAHAQRRQAIDLRIELAFGRLLEFGDLLRAEWAATLWIEVAPGFEFPVFFR